MIGPVDPRAARDNGAWALSVAVRLDRDGPEAAREPVTDADLLDARSEAWLECVLRRGRPDVPLENLETRVHPIPATSGRGCAGYVMEVVPPQGPAARRAFTLLSVEHVAARVTQRLVTAGRRPEGQSFYFNLYAERVRRGSRARRPAGGAPFSGRMLVEPLRNLDAPIEPLLRAARHVGPEQDAHDCTVFYTEEALERAERISRKGGESHPPVETGGALIGSLGSCPDTGELFLVVQDIIEAVDAENREFSLYYSDRTWARIQAVVQARQSGEATRTQRIVGQSHGHNFLPLNGAAPCDVCPKLDVCGRTSVFVSMEDINWSRAVFRRQPWHLSHIFGLNARREQVQGLFGLRDGRLQERGFHVIPSFPISR